MERRKEKEKEKRGWKRGSEGGKRGDVRVEDSREGESILPGLRFRGGSSQGGRHPCCGWWRKWVRWSGRKRWHWPLRLAENLEWREAVQARSIGGPAN